MAIHGECDDQKERLIETLKKKIYLKMNNNIYTNLNDHIK